MKKNSSQGIALVLVLASLVFLAALVMAFFTSVSTELQSSKVYSQGTNAKLLGQTAVNFVTAQISQACQGVDSAGSTLAWASQPGIIRTYDTTGHAAKYYRLYSWTDMTGSGAFAYDATDNTIPSGPNGWQTQKALFTDLNQPLRLVSSTGTSIIYPIVDGNNMVAGSTLSPAVSGTTYGSGSAAAIDGFYIKDAPVATGSNPNPVPMPVKWLYVLQDGQIVAPTSGGIANTVTVPGASSANPITGRIAFWADDESCKININTAAEGTYTDIPRAYSLDDWAQAQCQPVQKEYQRYPGHPAMTCLSSVLKKPNGTSDQEWASKLYGIAPRVKDGGSLCGTSTTANVSPAPTPIVPDSDRLYTSVDELAFKPTLTSGTERNLNDPTATGNDPSTATILNKDTLSRAKFFLTASSRAPDLNLFNKPRVSMWPITLDASSGVQQTTPYDKLIAFCSTIHGNGYYFQRMDPNHPTNDLDQISRNRTLLEYLRTLTTQDIPGFGNNFLNKYPGNSTVTDRDQILTEMFDYIRCTNLRDSSLWGSGLAGTTGTSWTGEYTKNLVSGNTAFPGIGQVVPIEDTTTSTRGFGRFPTVQGAVLHFIGGTNSTVLPGKVRVQAGLFISVFDPSLGQVLNKPWYCIDVEGAQNFKWDASGASGIGMGFPALATLTPSTANYTHLSFYGGWHYYRAFINATYPLVSNLTGSTASASQPQDFPAGGVFSFKGGDITVKFYRKDSSGNKVASPVLQTVTLNFPNQDFPVPQVAPVLTGLYPCNFQVFSGGRLTANEKLPSICSADVVRSVIATPGDMRLIAAQKQPPNALFAPHPLYTGTQYQFAHNLKDGIGYYLYGATSGKLVNVSYPNYPGSYANFTVSGITYRVNKINDQTSASTTVYDSSSVGSTRETDNPSPNGVTQINGVAADWDNGIANLRDGPYINKADEGDEGHMNGTQIFYPYYALDYTRADNLPGSSLFSPNRMIPSPGMFGSLSSGVYSNKPWQTLLFRPGPSGHPGLSNPPDHLFMDLFNMPVVEPYAISEPLSTAGRINMNYQIIPFTYIHRDAGLRAIFKSEKITSIPDTSGTTYKTITTGNGIPSNSWAGNYTANAFKQSIDPDATLKQFTTRFETNKDIFRSASEICSIDLVPADAPASTLANPTRANMDSYWASHKLTGDNTLERPYTTIYPRLTTKSNTFTIHYRAQSLQKLRGTDPQVWDENKDKIAGEYRGFQTVERYIDPNDTIPDYAGQPGLSTPISSYYKTRVVEAKQFAP